MPQAVTVSAPDLIDQAWDRFSLDPTGCVALSTQAVKAARAAGDTASEAFGLALEALTRAVRRGHEGTAALRALIDTTRQRCEQLGSGPAAWLCDDALARVEITANQLDQADARLRANLQRAGRADRERYVTLHALQRLAEHRGDFDEALHSSYALIELARGMGRPLLLANAKFKLACLQLNLLDLEHGMPLHDEAQAEFEAAGIAAMRASNLNSQVLTSHFRRAPQAGYAALQAWLARPEAQDPSLRHMLATPIALAYTGVGRLDEAEAALEAGEPMLEREWPDQVCMRIWVRGRLRCAQGRHAEALEMCQRFLDSGERTSPANLLQLHSVIAEAREALGDFQGALLATRQAMAAMTPMVGSSARAHYQSIRIERQLAGAPATPERDAQRLQALQRAVETQERETQRRIQESAAPAPAAVPDAQRRFVAQVSHEMRSQLNGLLGMTSLLMMSELDERQSRYVSLARTSAQNLLELANDILDLAKLEAGRFELELKYFSLRELLAEVVGLFEGDAQAKGVALHWGLRPEVADARHGAPLRVRQVLTNLVSNALRFTDQGSVRIQVDELAGARLRFEVIDSGVGLGDGAAQRLFNEFVQEQGHRGGTGLGLALCRQLVQHMGGEIGVASTPGRGSTFWFELPLPVAEPSAVGDSLQLQG